jgi:type III restriction enzyme
VAGLRRYGWPESIGTGGRLASEYSTIVDEPHKFSQSNVTWKNIQLFNSQYIFRFGATFTEYENLIYRLTAVEAFNQDLVKGVVAYVEDFADGKNISIHLTGLNASDKHATQATFELNDNGKKQRFKLSPKDSLAMIHAELAGVSVEKIGKSSVVFSDGLELKKGDAINPYLYGESLQDKMLRQAVARHFKLERELLTRDVKIKPLSLFFINNIESYRDDGHQIGGSLKATFEKLVKAQAKRLLKTETHPFYRGYLEKTLKDLSRVHGGYFSRDNDEKSEKTAQEVDEILHDKETLLSLDNPRRFIFSKWTLKEGWDNPNVFQICKLRSSGSDISKLQEVGRGLRLPVNEFMSRVKDERFELHYHVDFTESKFVEELVAEINEKSGALSQQPDKLTDELIQMIIEKYPEHKKLPLMMKLGQAGIINDASEFEDSGYEKLVEMFPNALSGGSGLKADKVRRADDKAGKKASFRVGKYDELKQLWEEINQKVVLEYKIKNEQAFADLIKAYFREAKENFKPQGSKTQKRRIEFIDGKAQYRDEVSVHDEVLPIATMSYKAFLLELADAISVNINTLHKVFVQIQGELDINLYRSMQTIRGIRAGFNKFLLDHAFGKFEVGYNKVASSVHPTCFTNESGQPDSTRVNAAFLGVRRDSQLPAKSFLFNELFYDSPLEKTNIAEQITDVTVFTKIPKNSIRIPVAGGGTYSPDFAYVVKTTEGKKTLNLIVETKDKDKRDLFTDEKQKIKHAETLFNRLNPNVDIVFETQFKAQKMVDIIKQAL